MTTDETEAKNLYNDITLGAAATAFLKSELGQYVIKRADREKDNALNELLTIDPTDAVKIREAQNKAMVCQTAISWMITAINEGNASGLILQSYRE